MGRLLINRDFLVHYGERFRELCRMHRLDVEPLTLPDNPDERFDDATLGTIELAAFTGVWEIDPVFTRRFLGSCLRARALRWLRRAR